MDILPNKTFKLGELQNLKFTCKGSIKSNLQRINQIQQPRMSAQLIMKIPIPDNTGQKSTVTSKRYQVQFSFLSGGILPSSSITFRLVGGSLTQHFYSNTKGRRLLTTATLILSRCAVKTVNKDTKWLITMP